MKSSDSPLSDDLDPPAPAAIPPAPPILLPNRTYKTIRECTDTSEGYNREKLSHLPTHLLIDLHRLHSAHRTYSLTANRQKRGFSPKGLVVLCRISYG